MSLALHQIVAEAEVKGTMYKTCLAKLSEPAHVASDLPVILGSITNPLSDLLAENDAEAVGTVILAAWGAYRHRVATRTAYGDEDVQHLPGNREAADDALAQLVLKRYKAGKA